VIRDWNKSQELSPRNDQLDLKVTVDVCECLLARVSESEKIFGA